MVKASGIYAEGSRVRTERHAHLPFCFVSFTYWYVPVCTWFARVYTGIYLYEHTLYKYVIVYTSMDPGYLSINCYVQYEVGLS